MTILAALAAICLHEAGKAITHLTHDHREYPRMHRPMVDGIPFSSPWHIASGVQWCLVAWVGFSVWGAALWPWCAAAAATAATWHLCKMATGKPWPPWWMQLYNWTRGAR